MKKKFVYLIIIVTCFCGVNLLAKTCCWEYLEPISAKKDPCSTYNNCDGFPVYKCTPTSEPAECWDQFILIPAHDECAVKPTPHVSSNNTGTQCKTPTPLTMYVFTYNPCNTSGENPHCGSLANVSAVGPVNDYDVEECGSES